MSEKPFENECFIDRFNKVIKDPDFDLEKRFLASWIKVPKHCVKYQTYTPESMKSYLDALAISLYEGWKREEGLNQKSSLPWVSYESPDGKWVHCWSLNEDGRLTKWQFDPNHEVNIVIKNG